MLNCMKKAIGGSGRFALRFVAVAVAVAGLSFAACANSGAEQAKRQARSVHLTWIGLPDDAVEVVGTVTVTEEQTNSYYMVIGFDGGYMGIQNFNGQHVGIFSIWDPTEDEYDSKAREGDVDPKIRATVRYTNENVTVSRFGGEGTGARTMFGCPWRVGVPLTFRLTAEPDGADRTLFTGYIGDGKEEVKLAAISRISHGQPSTIRGVYSFVEDFWRNGHSKTLVRRAEFTDFAARSARDKDMRHAVAARFTGDTNTLMTIDGGPVPGGGFLQTGGETKNEHCKLRSVFPCGKKDDK